MNSTNHMTTIKTKKQFVYTKTKRTLCHQPQVGAEYIINKRKSFVEWITK